MKRIWIRIKKEFTRVNLAILLSVGSIGCQIYSKIEIDIPNTIEEVNDCALLQHRVDSLYAREVRLYKIREYSDAIYAEWLKTSNATIKAIEEVELCKKNK